MGTMSCVVDHEDSGELSKDGGVTLASRSVIKGGSGSCRASQTALRTSHRSVSDMNGRRATMNPIAKPRRRHDELRPDIVSRRLRTGWSVVEEWVFIPH